MKKYLFSIVIASKWKTKCIQSVKSLGAEWVINYDLHSNDLIVLLCYNYCGKWFNRCLYTRKINSSTTKSYSNCSMSALWLRFFCCGWKWTHLAFSFYNFWSDRGIWNSLNRCFIFLYFDQKLKTEVCKFKFFSIRLVQFLSYFMIFCHKDLRVSYSFELFYL